MVTDVSTGEVLSLVSYPGYDNNKMANSVDPAYYSKLLADKTSPMLNYATQYAAAPGSTFKMVSATAALMEGEVSLSSKVNCTGAYTQVTPSPRCWRRSGHGSLNLTEAIQNSCNFFSTISDIDLRQKAGTTMPRMVWMCWAKIRGDVWI